MRILLLLAMLQLGACVQQSDLARQTNNPQPKDPNANPSVAALPVPTSAVVPVPTSSVTSGQMQYFCTSALTLC